MSYDCYFSPSWPLAMLLSKREVAVLACIVAIGLACFALLCLALSSPWGEVHGPRAGVEYRVCPDAVLFNLFRNDVIHRGTSFLMGRCGEDGREGKERGHVTATTITRCEPHRGQAADRKQLAAASEATADEADDDVPFCCLTDWAAGAHPALPRRRAGLRAAGAMREGGAEEAAGGSGAFVFPREYHFPAFFTLQPNLTTRHAQLAKWAALVLAYGRHHRLFRLRADEAADWDLFCNRRLGRRLEAPARRLVLDQLRRDGAADLLPGRSAPDGPVLLYWRALDDWAALVDRFVDQTGHRGAVMTLYELTEGDASRGTGPSSYSSLP